MDVQSRVRSVAVTVDAVWGSLFIAVAERLKRSFGSKIHIYVRSSEEFRHYNQLAKSGRWDSVTLVDALDRALSGHLPDRAEIVARARAHEARLDDTISMITLNHRQFGRGYSLGSFHYPRAPGYAGISHERMLHAYNELLSFWQSEAEQKGLTLFLHGDREVASTAAANGIAFRRMDTSRFKNYWFWTPNSYFFNPMVEPNFDTLNEWPSKATIEEAYGFSKVKNELFFARATLWGTIRMAVLAAVRFAGWKALGRKKARSYRFSDFVLFPLREYRAYRAMTGRRVVSLKSLAGKRFVYFPLHKEPEFSLQLMSPEYFNQHSAIVSLSRDLPAGVLLAIKENVFSLGRRPASFYAQVADLKNTVFLDVRERGIDVAQQSDAVVSITGTAGFEAAVFGKPVITFGRHNMYSLLDHCMTVVDEAELRGYLERALNGDIDREKAESDGARFLAAVVKSSFDMQDWGVVGEGKSKYQNFDETVLTRAYDALLASFDMPDVNMVSQVAGRA
jgi:Capsule polysaccharide biosynthesis protein